MSAHPRQRLDASRWSVLVERQSASGLSQREFCDTEGLAVSTFSHWKRKLAGVPTTQHRRDADRPLFTPLHALTEPAEAPIADEASASSWSVDLDLGDGLRLTIRKVA